SSIEGRITNGQAAVDGQFPYQVGLSFSSSSGSWWCGGSIIDHEWVLTAAHCTNGASAVTVYYDATVRTSPKLTHTVSSSNFIQHASYNSVVLRNDISLIKTPYVTYTSNIKNVPLPKLASSYSTYAGQTAIASGFGKVSDSATSVSNHLNFMESTVITNSACAGTYGSLIITSGVICIGTAKSISTCNGDSGGPLVLQSDGELIGVTSFVSSNGCESNSPAGFARVTYYRQWIETNSVWRSQPQYTHYVHQNDFVQHHAYDTNTINNDISLIRTPHVDFWSLVNKVELPSYNDRYNNYYGSWALLSGWGKTSDDSGVAEYLNCVDIQIADNSICESYYGTTVITPNHVCIATPENKGSCGGDSGGPLVLHDGNRQVAIVSFGSSAGCLSNSPKGMTRVTSYLDWIRDNTGI
ncbi:hypothetical protein KR067_010507, partial [Drosophila pandora]